MKSVISGKNLKRIWDLIEQNQQEYEGYKKNYVSNISRELDLHRNTVISGFDFMEYELEVATTWREDNKRYIRITVDRGNNQAYLLPENIVEKLEETAAEKEVPTETLMHRVLQEGIRQVL